MVMIKTFKLYQDLQCLFNSRLIYQLQTGHLATGKMALVGELFVREHP